MHIADRRVSEHKHKRFKNVSTQTWRFLRVDTCVLDGSMHVSHGSQWRFWTHQCLRSFSTYLRLERYMMHQWPKRFWNIGDSSDHIYGSGVPERISSSNISVHNDLRMDKHLLYPLVSQDTCVFWKRLNR